MYTFRINEGTVSIDTDLIKKGTTEFLLNDTPHIIVTNVLDYLFIEKQTNRILDYSTEMR